MHACAQTQLRLRMGENELVAVHRLDRLTGGLLLFSRRQSGRGYLQTQFARREVVKTYHAVAPDLPEFSLGEEPYRIDLRMAKIPHDPQVKVMLGEVDQGKPGKLTTTFITKIGVGSAAGLADGLARYELSPVTGHNHQLRVLMNYLGAPIVGDDTYPVHQPREVWPVEPVLQLRAVGLGIKVPGGEFVEFRLPG